MIGVLFGVFLLGYVGYCWKEQGMHSRYQGWKTREEAPVMFVVMTIIYIILGLLMVVGTLLFKPVR